MIEYMAGFPTPLDQVWKGDIFSAIKIIE